MAEENEMLYRCVTRLGRIRKQRSLLSLCVIAGIVFAVWKVGFHGTKQNHDAFQKLKRKATFQFSKADIIQPQQANIQPPQQDSSQHNMQQLHQVNDHNNVKAFERKTIYQFVREDSDKDTQESPTDDQLYQQLQQVQDRYQQQLMQRQQNQLQQKEVDKEQQLQEQRLQQQEVDKQRQLQEQRLQQQELDKQQQLQEQRRQQQEVDKEQQLQEQRRQEQEVDKEQQLQEQKFQQQKERQKLYQQQVQLNRKKLQQQNWLRQQSSLQQALSELNIPQPVRVNTEQNIQQPQQENIQQHIPQENIQQNIQQPIEINNEQNIQQPQQENIQQHIPQENIQQNTLQPQQDNIQQNIQQPIEINNEQNIQQPQQGNIQQYIQQPQLDDIQQNIQQPIEIDNEQNIQQPEQDNIQQNIPQEIIQQNIIQPQQINDPQNVPQPQQSNNEQFIQQQQHIYDQQNILQSQKEHIQQNIPQTQHLDNPQNIEELQQVNIQRVIQQPQDENIQQNIPQPQQANNQQNIPQLQQLNNLQTIQQQQEKDLPQGKELSSQGVDMQQETQNRPIGEHEQLVQHQEAVQVEKDSRNIGQPLNQVPGQKKFKQISTFWPPPHLKPAPFREKLPVVISWNILMGTGDYELVCKTRRCLLAHNHEERHKHQVVGILFYGTSFAGDGLPLPRQPGHIWSILHEESPKNNDWLFNAKGAMELFNLTATFKRESHYPLTTMWLKGEDELMSTEYVVSLEKKNALRREGLAPVVFVHSDCNTPSDRSHYMKLLQKHLHIDSYGKCEHNKDFPAANMTFDVNMEPLISSEFFKVVAKYKFAFAFENTVCDDYVTEKFWRPLTLGVVPIVHGSPRIKDLAPTDHSIIDIRDFRSVQEVAEHIIFLDGNDEEYRKYVDFKETGITNPVLKKILKERDWGPGTFNGAELTGFQCYLCEKVHELQDILVAGQPAPHWQGSHDHYGCPRPKTFDEEGHYVNDNVFWGDEHSFGHYYYKSLQHHIDTINDAKFLEIQKYAKDLEKYDKQHNIQPDV